MLLLLESTRVASNGIFLAVCDLLSWLIIVGATTAHCACTVPSLFKKFENVCSHTICSDHSMLRQSHCKPNDIDRESCLSQRLRSIIRSSFWVTLVASGPDQHRMQQTSSFSQLVPIYVMNIANLLFPQAGGLEPHFGFRRGYVSSAINDGISKRGTIQRLEDQV